MKIVCDEGDEFVKGKRTKLKSATRWQSDENIHVSNQPLLPWLVLGFWHLSVQKPEWQEVSSIMSLFRTKPICVWNFDIEIILSH